MATTYMETDTTRMASDISALRSDTARARSHLKALETELESLSSTWTGEASTAFRQAYESDCAVMERMLSVVDSLVECMQTAKKEYTSCEQSVKSMVSSIRI